MELIDFGYAGSIDDHALGFTYFAPEFRKRTLQGKPPRLSTKWDVFALGLMIVELMTNFAFWEGNSFCLNLGACKDVEFRNYEAPFVLPETLDPIAAPKLEDMLCKNADERISIAKFSEWQLFKKQNTKSVAEIGNTNVLAKIDKFEVQVKEVSSGIKEVSSGIKNGSKDVKKGMVNIDSKLAKMHKNLNSFLPAIQENIMQVLTATG